jgi:hypothetical protein
MQPDPEPEIIRLLVEYTDLPLRPLGEADPGARGGWDAVLHSPDVTFFVEYKNSASTDAIGSALRRVEERELGRGQKLPLLVVPYMGDVGKELCRRAGVAWLDLSGNARIITPRMRILVEGRPNRFARKGRPSDPFAPKASRVARALLLRPDAAVSQAEIAAATGLDKGFLSRTVRRLEAAALIERDAAGRIRVSDPGRLLAAWRASYDFSRHTPSRFVVAARSGPELLNRAVEKLQESGIEHAATGLAAAWMFAPFAVYRTVTLYVAERPGAEVLKRMGARDMESGANLWLAVPNDEGVFAGAEVRSKVRCVSPLQVYLDLKAQPERGEEAAEALRRACLPWAT